MKSLSLFLALLLPLASLWCEEPAHDSENPLITERTAAEIEVTFLGLVATKLSTIVRRQLGLPGNLYLSVVMVSPDGPAQKAGLRHYDVLKKFDDQILVNPEQLVELVRSSKVGQQVTLTIQRRGKEKTLKVKLGSKKKTGLADSLNRIQEIDSQIGQIVFPDARILEDRIRKQIERQARAFGQRGLNRDSVSPEVLEKFDADGDGKLSSLEWDKAMDEEAIPGIDLDFGLNLDFGSGPDLDKLINDVRKSGGVSSWSSVSGSAKTKIVNSDVDGSYEFTSEDGKKHFRVISSDGEVLFDGPVDTEEERAAIPGGLVDRLESLEGSIRINIRQFGADLKPKPNKKKEKSSF
jgi:hypothetical protein